MLANFRASHRLASRVFSLDSSEPLYGSEDLIRQTNLDFDELFHRLRITERSWENPVITPGVRVLMVFKSY